MIKTERIFKYRLRLFKDAGSITQHEERRMLRAALLESGLKCVLNKGNPRFLLGPCAKQDEESSCEYADICLAEEASIEEINIKLSPHIMGGFKLQEVKEVPYGLCSVEALADSVLYTVYGINADTDKFNSARQIGFEITHPNGMREFKDIKPSIISIRNIGGDMEIIIKLSALGSFGLGQILETLPGLEVGERKLKVLRGALLWHTPQGLLEAV